MFLVLTVLRRSFEVRISSIGGCVVVVSPGCAVPMNYGYDWVFCTELQEPHGKREIVLLGTIWTIGRRRPPPTPMAVAHAPRKADDERSKNMR
ncbi:hypothetical protein HPB47_025515, partial [Ixodes persulcatus]